MRNRSSKPKRPNDPNQLAKLVVGLATGEQKDPEADAKTRAISEARRKGGLKGGRSRAARLAPEKRAEVASLAATARWKKRKN